MSDERDFKLEEFSEYEVGYNRGYKDGRMFEFYNVVLVEYGSNQL